MGISLRLTSGSPLVIDRHHPLRPDVGPASWTSPRRDASMPPIAAGRQHFVGIAVIVAGYERRGANARRSIVVAAPVTISSASANPVAGAFSMPHGPCPVAT